jgi:hypothetical protein
LVADIETKLAVAKQQLEQKQQELEQLRSVASGGTSNGGGSVREGILISFDDDHSVAVPVARASPALSAAPFSSKMTDACLQALCNYCRVLIASHHQPPPAAYSLANQVWTLNYRYSLYSYTSNSSRCPFQLALHLSASPRPLNVRIMALCFLSNVAGAVLSFFFMQSLIILQLMLRALSIRL